MEIQSFMLWTFLYLRPRAFSISYLPWKGGGASFWAITPQTSSSKGMSVATNHVYKQPSHEDERESSDVAPTFLTWSLDWGWLSASRLSRLTPVEGSSGTLRIGGWVYPRVSLHVVENGSLTTTGNQPRALQSVPHRKPDCATPAVYTHDNQTNKQTNSVASVHERTIPTEQPPFVIEVSANFCG
jgi:hypothetical protein